MSAVILLFVVGILLLGIEVFVPGAILGVIGVISMLSGCVVAFNVFGSTGGFIAVGVALALLGLTLFIEFVVLPKTALGRAFFVKEPSRPTEADGNQLVGLIGHSATTETVLAPSGYVLVGAARHEAMSQTGLIAKGAQVTVVGSEGARLIVSFNR